VGDEAGIVVPPGDQQTLAHALESALDPRVREKLAQGARRVRERLASWDDAVTKMESVLERAGA
jgi:glycosyltransferase involved in cell wall biosynthesis